MLRRLAAISLPAAALLLAFLVREASLPASERRPVRQSDLVRWAAQHAQPLRSTDPLSPLDDLSSLGFTTPSTKVIAMGEATHGTREFFQMKHRILRYAVEHAGFRVFGIEASLVAAERVNRYVLTGNGDATKAVKGLNLWPWMTEEVLALTEWMRGWNAAHPDAPVVFYGFDCQPSSLAARTLLDYLARVEPDAPQRFRGTLSSLSRDWSEIELSNAELNDARRELLAVSALFEARREAWIAVTDEADWHLAKRCVRVIEQSAELRRQATIDGLSGRREPSREYGVKRDRFMAENVEWILRRQSSRAVLWAHNGHVARRPLQMGSHLAARLGEDYVVVGFAFGEGRFRARRDRGSPVSEISVSSRGAGDFDHSLSTVASPLFALDLRDAPSSLNRAMTLREFGAVYVRWMESTTVAEDFDILIFVRETTSSRPLR